MSDSLFEQYKAALRRGHMAALAGELDEALAAYDAAARLVPERALPLASRGTVLHRLDRWPEAAAAFDRALQLAPDDEAALRARASARSDRGLRSGAAADFERLALVLDVAGRAAPAAEAARRAADLEPTEARESLAIRLGATAEQLADPSAGKPAFETGQPRIEDADQPHAEPAPDSEGVVADEPEPEPAEPEPEPATPIDQDPWSAALAAQRLEGLDGDAGTDEASNNEALTNEAAPAPPPWADSAAYDALEALRAEMDTGGGQHEGAAGADVTDEARADAPAAAAVSVEDGAADGSATGAPALGGAALGEEAAEGGGTWPGIDLPSPPPPPIEGPPPDPEELLAEAALVLEQGEIDAARDLMLTAARVHRDAGRIDAALEICLNLLSIAPGEPRVHLAIANLQLDRGWTGVATEKLDLLVRLTSLTGDTQAEADVHGLASERLRDDPATSTAGR